MEFVDTHAHLTDEAYNEDLIETLERAKSVDVTKIITMGDTVENSAASLRLAEEYSGIFAAVGVHPETAAEWDKNSAEKLYELAKSEKVVGIGEIGLDYYWEKDEEKKELQRKIFIEQLRLAKELNLPVCVHDRDAHGDTLKILKTEGKGVLGVCHCFSGSYEMAAELFKMDFYIGVDGPLTFKNAAKLPEILAKSPKDRALLETDSPYLSPAPMRGKRNEPANIPHIAAKLAEIWNASVEEVAEITTGNAKRLYQKTA
ncbi:MAG: TatD family hydrolase [Selenomonadaceae bacterium]|nr:TatD family hydrolase [Selenomonadaceae bacterium]